MRKSLYLLGFIPIFEAFTACNQAKFKSGAAENRPQEPLTFSCSVKPETIELGQLVEIAVTSNRPFQNKLFERVKVGDAVTELELIAKDGGFQLQDGPNKFKAEAAGKHTIEIRTDAEGEVKASCGFEVTPAACRADQQLIGANVAFIIDNSYSHSETDCQNIDRNLWNSQKRVYCQSPTNREKAVLSAFDVLDQVARDASYVDLATSSLAIASFPTRDNSVNGSRIHTNGWVSAKADVKSSIESGLLFTREPTGYTPYGAGLRAAQSLFAPEAKLATEKAKVAVLVTDGEPTDRNPRDTVAVAQKLREQGVEVITVFVTQGKTREERRNRHISFLREEDSNWYRATNGRDNWYDRQIWSSFDPFIGELMGNGANPQLVDRITAQLDPSCQDTDSATCARKIIEVSNSAELEKVFRQIVKNSTRCE
jgi:hypothetical protein